MKYELPFLLPVVGSFRYINFVFLVLCNFRYIRRLGFEGGHIIDPDQVKCHLHIMSRFA